MKFAVLALIIIIQVQVSHSADVVLQKIDYPGETQLGSHFEAKCTITADRMVTKTFMKAFDESSPVKIVKKYLQKRHTVKMLSFLIGKASEETTFFNLGLDRSSISDLDAYFTNSKGERELVHLSGGAIGSRKYGNASSKLEEILKDYCAPIKRSKEV